MGLALQVVCLVVKLFAIAVALVVQRSAGYEISPSPATFSAIPSIQEQSPGHAPRGKRSNAPSAKRSNAPSSESQSNGSVLHPPSVLVPRKSTPSPQTVKGIAPSLSPSTPTVPPPYSSVPPPLTFHGIVPSLPPSAPEKEEPKSKNPISVPVTPAASPSNKSTQKPPTIHPIMPGSMPPSSHQIKAPDSKAPLSMPIAPVPNALVPKKMPQNLPPSRKPIMPGVPPSIFPVPVASPPSKLLRNSPTTHPTIHKEPPSNSPVPVASPPSKLLRNSPTTHPTIRREPPSNSPGYFEETHIHIIVVDMPVASPPSKLLRNSPTTHPTIRREPPSNSPVPVASPPSKLLRNSPTTHPTIHREPPSNSPAPSMHKALRHSNNIAPPLSSPKSPLDIGSHSPASLPSTSFHKHHHAKNNFTNTAPSSVMPPPPPASSQQDPIIPPAPSYPSKTHPKSRLRDHAPPPMNPESHVSPAPSPSSTAPSRQTKFPFLSPKISPSGSSPKNPKMPLSPPIQALPPPPPNEDCSSLTCTEPLTNNLPGSPCGCVLPMQVGLRLNVALYTFFPLVSEIAQEIAVGVFMKQSQVRIMGANAASQDPEKTIVLVDLVPLGDKFDNTTAYLTFERFWHKQVAIKTSLFGDYEVLYLRYPGLPPSPPSSINVIDGGPNSGQGNNGTTIQPLGVDVRQWQHKDGLGGSVIAIIVLSASIVVILCCVIAWVILFKHRDFQEEPTPLATLPSLSKPSGIAASMFGSWPSSASLSFGSSVATYAGSAKTFSSSDIERATNNFNASRILGEGGFGRVYSGVLEDGTKVAVKVLKRDDQQGGREFMAEVEMLSRLHHRNLVKLIGICIEERSRCLVYELIPNGSVESHLHGVDKETAPLDWGARMKIALGAARGLAYLHEDSSPRVIHRDFKSSNILLEHDFTSKVADFGLARSALEEENRHICTRVMGTFGYVAPEYAMTGHLLVKSDVYSYGVVLLELLSGRKPVDMSRPPGQENLVTWARPLLTSKEGIESIVDLSLGPDFPFDSISKVAAIASMCVQPEVSHRPFMGEVVQALKLVCSENDETKALGSRSCSHEDMSIDMDATRICTNSGQLPDPLQTHSPFSNYDLELGVERGLSMPDLFGTSAGLGGQEPGSFRRYSSSGILKTGRGMQLWQKMRRSSGGTASEHGEIFRLWPGSY
ncbi:receptor-like serine/threonine-protein kinase ALE2 isoform X8 [Camellia sinensis]|uniref:receptor-like serine/threonine-protein kinase ALE2 isoform X8 n=1 Tax=Camellia sinensis TaxID=4442 RepID=UPI0010356B67|nr:receptor-like serine/threonine-protein kinase ALE2 isoform X8 [Camellia sinensis]